ncbi:protein translocase subunit SecF [Rickettsiales bacterium]|nr:protein translocase subunit SecF [Rickettsiales bacterium]
MYLRIIPDNTKINFVKQGRICMIASIAIMLLSILLVFTKGINFGIDFTGGAEIEAKTTDEISLGEIKGALQKFGPIVQKTSKDGEILIRAKAENDAILTQMVQTLKNKFSDKLIYKKADYIGPQISKDMVFNGYKAVTLALLGMMIYLGFRFGLLFSFSGIFALIHDVATTIGFFAITQLEFSTASVIALLTIIGYSINDSVVIYERIRDNRQKHQQKLTKELINSSVNETLSRTILTSITTLIAAVMLAIFSGKTLGSFSWAIVFGVAIGTYSSIFIAPQIIILCKRKTQ